MINSFFVYRGHNVRVCGHAGNDNIDAFGSIERIDNTSWLGWIHAFVGVADAVAEAKRIVDEAEDYANSFLYCLRQPPPSPASARQYNHPYHLEKQP